MKVSDALITGPALMFACGFLSFKFSSYEKNALNSININKRAHSIVRLQNFRIGWEDCRAGDV